MWNTLRIFNLAVAFVATTAPAAHVLELKNKLALDGATWLVVQQQLYRGWGPVFGTVEILALASSVLLVFVAGRDRRSRNAYVVACICYALMVAVFFAFNDPVNRAFAGWTPSTLPADWPAFRLKWESGHATAALLSLVALAAIVRAGWSPAKLRT